MEEKRPDNWIEFTECPNCGCTDTVTRLAWNREADVGRISKESRDMPLRAANFTVPLIDPRKGPGLVATVVVYDLDICDNCGTCYCVRSYTQTGPVQISPGGQMPHGGNTQPPGGFPFLRG